MSNHLPAQYRSQSKIISISLTESMVDEISKKLEKKEYLSRSSLVRHAVRKLLGNEFKEESVIFKEMVRKMIQEELKLLQDVGVIKK